MPPELANKYSDDRDEQGYYFTTLRHRTHVPYKNSKLTHLLKDSLGGNCKTIIIAHISPLVEDYHQSLMTLNHAERARSIRNPVKINYLQVKDLHGLPYESRLIAQLKIDIETKGISLEQRTLSDFLGSGGGGGDSGLTTSRSRAASILPSPRHRGRESLTFDFGMESSALDDDLAMGQDNPLRTPGSAISNKSVSFNSKHGKNSNGMKNSGDNRGNGGNGFNPMAQQTSGGGDSSTNGLLDRFSPAAMGGSGNYPDVVSKVLSLSVKC